MSDQIDPMAEIKASFFVECEELLESLQDSLQIIDDGEGDNETINVVFRAVHSIKGGAGAFGLNDLVNFAHRYETVLDEVRSGKLDPDADARRLFFTAADMLSDLVRASRDGETIDPEKTGAILAELDATIGLEPGQEEEEEVTDFAPMTLSLDLDANPGEVADGLPDLPDLADLGGLSGLDPDEDDGPATTIIGYEVRFRPHWALYEAKNEPLFVLKFLSKLGETSITTDYSDVPPLSDRTAETATLVWTAKVLTDAGEEAVRELFEFVDDLCDLTITPLEGPGPEEPSGAKPELGDDAPPLQQTEQAAQPAPPAAAAIAPEAPAAKAEKKVPAQTSEPAQPEAATKSAAAQPKATVRVDLDKIDRLVNQVGELVINQAMLSQSVSEAGIPSNSTVAQGLDEFMQLTRDIQDSVMMIRAQPVKSLFQRMSRIVREASATVSKDVRLKTSGESTEVDKTVIERLADPLTHMIRNAVDHGLEKTEDRVAAGKSETGIVSLTAAHRSGRVIIEVGDDGGGINREKVLQKATDKGLVPPNATLTDGEIDNLLFMPGFSTADQVSSISGRGVGMDVVKSSIQALGGRVTISSQRGLGTTFSISLPLTLAVLDGMVVEVAGETIVVPLNAIVETLTVTEENLRPLGAEGFVVDIRGGFAPLIDLGVELGYRRPLDNYCGTIVLVIGLDNGNRTTLVVDAIQDQRQVVIKGLQRGFGDIPGIAAATILGDGQIALILDPVDLTKQKSSSLSSNSDFALKKAG